MTSGTYSINYIFSDNVRILSMYIYMIVWLGNNINYGALKNDENKTM